LHAAQDGFVGGAHGRVRHHRRAPAPATRGAPARARRHDRARARPVGRLRQLRAQPRRRRRRGRRAPARRTADQRTGMMDRPEIVLRGPVLDAPPGDEALALAAFYERLLGWPITQSNPGGWALLQSPDGLKIEIQGLLDYQPPTWPNSPDEQQMMLHID